MTSNSTEVVIVGGGAAGCAVAYFLGVAGVSSTIVEREGIGAFASGYSAGGLNPLEGAGIPGSLGPLAITSHRMHLSIWDDLIERTRIDFQPEIISSVRVAFDAFALDEMRETKQTIRPCGLRLQRRMARFTAAPRTGTTYCPGGYLGPGYAGQRHSQQRTVHPSSCRSRRNSWCLRHQRRRHGHNLQWSPRNLCRDLGRQYCLWSRRIREWPLVGPGR